jgi:hypothetical protein
MAVSGELMRGNVAATNTLDAGSWALLFARKIGKRDRFVCAVTGFVLTTSTWDGKEFLIDVEVRS